MRNKLTALLGSTVLAGLMAFTGAQAEESMYAGKSDGSFMVRARGIYVMPDESSSLSIAGLEADASSALVPEVDFTYFFTPNIAAELIVATTPHDVKTKGAANVDLGSVWLLPPTITAQYHFTNFGAFKPYVGAGINYTIFYNEDSGAAADIEYENGFGFALQAGIDYEIGDGIYLNADVKKLWLSTDVKVTGPDVTGSVDLDPWIFGVGVGYRF
ncbi:MAG: outer membrane beta-barrel protein [Neomegalonema sp.]|nr:outer membrane beta-barrel protein [Neomegalonema sp.]